MPDVGSSSGSLIVRGEGLWRHSAAVSALALLASLVGLAIAVPAQAATVGGFPLDGRQPTLAELVPTSDPSGSAEELGPGNGSTEQLNVIHKSPLPAMWGYTNSQDSADFTNVWFDTNVVADDVFLYLAWERAASSGNGTFMYEFQRNPRPDACDYDGIDGKAPIDPAEVTLGAACQPWAGREAGDFVVVFDMQGSGFDVSTRTYEPDGKGGLRLGAKLLAPADSYALDHAKNPSFGEMVVNLSETVFKGVESCLTFANVIPGSMTGNSDQASFMDVVLTGTEGLFVSNCAEVKVVKDTEPDGGKGPFGVQLARRGGGDTDYDGTKTRTDSLGADTSSVTWTGVLKGADYRLTEPVVGDGYLHTKSVCAVVGPGGVLGTPYDVKDKDLELLAGEQYVCTITNFKPSPGISVVKAADPKTVTKVGDVVTWKADVTNTGNVPLAVSVSDPLCPAMAPVSPSGDANGDGKLDLAETWKYSCAEVVDQADVDAGGGSNTITATGTHEGSADVTSQSTDTYSVARAPALAVDKAVIGAGSGYTLPGTADWKITVENSGNVTLEAVQVTDPECDADPAYVSGDAVPRDEVMSVGETWVYGCSTTLDQAHVDAGGLDNVAIGSAQSPTGERVSDTGEASISTLSTADLALAKTVVHVSDDPGEGAVAGDTLLYTVKATNKGTTTLSDVVVTDPLCPVDATSPVNRLTLLSGDQAPVQTMQPGETWVYACSYTVTQADVDAGPTLTNTATALATPVAGALLPITASVSDLAQSSARAEKIMRTASAVIGLNRAPQIDVVKTGDRTAGALGTPVTYVMSIENTGTVTLTSRALVDPLCQPALSTDTELSPKEKQTYTCTRPLSQGDVDAGSVVNTVTGTARFGDTTLTDRDTWTVEASRTPGIGISKQADPGAGLEAGDEVVYTLAVRNTGNVSLSDVTVADPLCAPTATGGDVANPGVLDLSEVWTYTCTYTVVQRDVEAGAVVNVATASGTGAGQTVSRTATATVTTLQTPAIAVDKTATAASDARAGDPVLYTVVVENGGNVPLSGVVASDPLCTLVQQSGDEDGDGVLQLTETWTYTCTYVLTQADVDAGKRDNTATATGSWGGTPVTDSDSATVPLQQTRALSITKTPNPTTYDAVGDVIGYSYVVTNSGNTTLPGPFSVADDKASVSCPATAQLAVTASITCTASYVITQADMDAGSVVNVASATNGTVASPQVTARVDRVGVPATPPTPRILPFVEPEPSTPPAATPSPAVQTPRVLPLTGGSLLLPMLALGSGAMLVGALLVGAARSRRPQTP